MFCYVECQAACFDWLCCLLPDCPNVPSPPRGGHALKYDELGGLWHPGIVTGCLALLFRSSSPYATLSIMMVCICSFPSPPCLLPLQTDTCLYKVYPLRSDMLNIAWRISLKTSIHHCWEHTYDASELFHSAPTFKLWNLWWLSPCLFTSLLEPTSGGYVALIVTQQVAHRGQDSVLPFQFLRQICWELEIYPRWGGGTKGYFSTALQRIAPFKVSIYYI